MTQQVGCQLERRPCSVDRDVDAAVRARHRRKRLGVEDACERIRVFHRPGRIAQALQRRGAEGVTLTVESEAPPIAVGVDAFGMAWYGHHTEPGLYRDVLPAWSDGNLTSLCRMVRSHLFLAHVRASTVGETSRTNCHPFTFGRWSFMHNGQIPEFNRIRRSLEASLPDRLYHARRGSTDSELLFLLTLANGLDDGPKRAIEKTIAQVRDLQGSVDGPNRITCVLSDGTNVYGFRHACDDQSPTLYLSTGFRRGGQVLASEPLDGNPDNWQAIAEGEFVELGTDGFTIERLRCGRPTSEPAQWIPAPEPARSASAR